MGGFKTFPIGQDEHLLTVLRYIEYNPVRAGLVERAEQWPWSNARWWRPGEPPPLYLHEGPVLRGPQWLDFVNQPLDGLELTYLRTSINRGRPYGKSAWAQETAARLGLGKSLRPLGRPTKTGAAPPHAIPKA